jgi:uncharacterized membrane protein
VKAATRMTKKRREYIPFKAHFRIPFILSLLIVIAGIIMTLTNQTDLGYFKGRGSGREDFILTGPATIFFGLILATTLLYIKKYLK